MGVDAFDADGVLWARDVQAFIVDDVAPGTGETVLAQTLQFPAGDAAYAAVQASVRLALQLL